MLTFLPHPEFGLGLSFLSAAVMRSASRVAWVMDIPNQRSSHTHPVSKFGGVAIVAAFIAGALVLAGLSVEFPIGPSNRLSCLP